MTKKIPVAVVALVLVAAAARAHVTPNVQLLARGDFIKATLAGATKFFEKPVVLDGAQRSALRQATGWDASAEDTKVYVGRDDGGGLVGIVLFLWMPSQHGPVGIAAAFDVDGKLLRADVTDVGSEPLDWVRPLLANGGLTELAGLSLDEHPAATKIGPGVTGRMSRYYAKVIADGVARAQALESAMRSTIH